MYNSIKRAEECWCRILVVIQIYKKIVYNIVTELQKTIEKSMATGIAQKSYTALFPLWSLKKNDISKMKIKI